MAQGDRIVRAVPQRAAYKRKRSTDWSLVVFVASLCLLAFLYGIIANEFDLPPKQQMRQAMSALKAISLLEDDASPVGLIRTDPDAEPRPSIRTFEAAAGDELLLVTGGPDRDLERCPRYGCLAWIVDRSGKVLHSWPLPLGELFDGVQGFAGDVDLRNFYPFGLGLLRDGSLVAVFHSRNTYPYAVGVARIDWNGKVLWKHIDGAHHLPHVGLDERIYAPIQIRRQLKHVAGNAVELRCPRLVNDEGVRIYRPDGTVEQTVLMAEVLIRNGYPGLVYSIRDGCDPIHLNSVDVATPEVASRIPGVVSGDVLVSLREPSAIVLFDPVTAKIKHLLAGRTAAQHSARFLPDGTILAFDNLGGARSLGGSRIVRINLVDGTVQTLFPTGASRPVLPFFTETGGVVRPSPDGKRALISSEYEGRLIEVDLATGRPLWTTNQVFDVRRVMKARGERLAGYFNDRGGYYVTDDQARALKLR